MNSPRVYDTSGYQVGQRLQTRFGSDVEVLSLPDSKGWLKVRRLSDGAEREWNLKDMRLPS